MEEDANSVLRFMASNGLVANAKKTSFLQLNAKRADVGLTIRIGNDAVPRDVTGMLLGVKFQERRCPLFTQ